MPLQLVSFTDFFTFARVDSVGIKSRHMKKIGTSQSDSGIVISFLSQVCTQVAQI